MKRQILIGAAIAAALAYGWLAWGGLSFLQRGYSLNVAMAGHSGAEHSIQFPAWRLLVHLFLAMATITVIGAYIRERRWAARGAWLTFAATCAVGIHDVAEHGPMGSPTSI